MIFTCKGSPGRVCWVPNPIDFCIAQDMVGIRANEKIVYPKYLFALLRSEETQNKILNMHVGTLIPHFKKGDFGNLYFDIPTDMEYQKRVGDAYFDFCLKIEANRQINQTLESMAQAIFQSWFVDFDPVKAKIAAREQWQILTDEERTEWLNELLDRQDYFKTCLLELTAKAGLNDDENLQLDSSLDLISCRGHGPESSESLDIGLNNLRKEWQSKKVGPALQNASETLYLNIAAMTAISSRNETSLAAMPVEEFAQLYKTASLFPERLVDSELGEIPEGWEVTTFGSVAKCFDKHRIPLSKAQREKVKGNIPYYGATSVMDYVDEYIFDGIYLLLGEDGSVLKPDGSPFVQYVWGKSWVNNHAHVLQGCNSISTEQLLLFISCQNIAAYVTGAVQLKLNQKNMNSIPFIKAACEINIDFYNLIKSFYASIREMQEQIFSLEELRDSLLPKLLSGELDVSSLTELSDIEPAAMDV
ncbi:restriction endonuclease subunit S [Thalassolituus oleivorans]|uniref:restriction endonuclease subunit S n=1 Tax=Thalassolituus oleivorans TaxID=187493 RepID=UPI001CE2D442|nr:restriction endonuclease subunit S [Thalassolituus oleivorans]MCA6127350.1 hypothetical protein [Thalassolituus oleivorans 4BN06-13]